MNSTSDQANLKSRFLRKFNLTLSKKKGQTKSTHEMLFLFTTHNPKAFSGPEDRIPTIQSSSQK